MSKRGTFVAIKVIENSPNKHDEIQTESGILQRFGSHKNIVDYFGTYIYSKPGATPQVWIVIEVCKKFLKKSL